MNKVAERLRNNCGFQRAVKRGLSNYPYGEHLQDCDICQGAEEIESMQARIELLEKVVEAAKPLSDNLTCLDSECVHEICVLNRALAALKE